jgi:hypothetical protein
LRVIAVHVGLWGRSRAAQTKSPMVLLKNIDRPRLMMVSPPERFGLGRVHDLRQDSDHLPLKTRRDLP